MLNKTSHPRNKTGSETIWFGQCLTTESASQRTNDTETNDAHICADAQICPICPASAAPCATDQFLRCDGCSARKRSRAFWKGAFPGRLQYRRPGRFRPCACYAAHLLVSGRGQDVYGYCPERPRLRHGALGYCRNCDRQSVRWAGGTHGVTGRTGSRKSQSHRREKRARTRLRWDG